MAPSRSGRSDRKPSFFALEACGCAVAMCAAALGFGHAVRVTAQQPEVRIEQAAWLAGCWESSSPQRTVEEQWSVPRGQTMLGTGRTVRDGKTTEYEFVVLKVQDGRLAYEAHPSEQPSAVFLSRELRDGRIVFENAGHDFPQLIGYERQGADALLAWIEGAQNGRTRRVEFPYKRVACH